MAQVRITHQDGTVDEITTSGATQQIQVQQGDKIEVVNATLTSATVDGNNYVVTLTDASGTVEITFVDLFLLLATGDPTTTVADGSTSLFIGETEIASIGDALSQVATAAGGGQAGDGQPLGDQPASDGHSRAPTQPDFDDLGTAEAPKGPLLGDFPADEPPADDPVVPDEEVPIVEEPNIGPTAIDDFNMVTEDGEGGGGGGGGEPVTVDFNGQSGSVLSYTEGDVTFTQTDGNTIFFSNSPNATTAGIPQNPGDVDTARADIVGGATSVSVDLGDFNADADRLFLEIFDADDNSLGIVTVDIANSFVGLETLTIDAPDGTVISYAVFGTTGELGLGGIYFDNFTYTPANGGGGSGDSAIGNVLSGDGDPDSVADSDPESDPLTVVNVSSTAGGDIVPDADGENIAGDYGTLEIQDDGSYVYTLDNGDPAVQALGDGESLTDVFTYTMSDGNGGFDTATLTITINGTNDGPTADADTHKVVITGAVSETDSTGNVLGTEALNSGEYSYTDIDHGNSTGDDADSDPDGDQLVVQTGDTTGGDAYGTLTLNADGSYTYDVDETDAAVIALGAGETLTEVYTYTINDGSTKTDTATLTITISGTNDGPTADADTNAVDATMSGPATNATGNVLGTESGPDGNGDFAYADISHGADGTDDADSDPDGDQLAVQTFDATGADQYGELTLNADGSYTYDLDETDAAVIALDDGETLVETYTYTVTDGIDTDTATLTITINGTNDGPTADADTHEVDATMVGNGPATNAIGNVLGTVSGPAGDKAYADIDHGNGTGDDADGDPDGDELFVQTGDTTGGDDYGTLTLNADGSYTYNLDETDAAVIALDDGETLVETYTYTINDGSTKTDTATLTITINGTNDGPVAVNDAGTVDEDSIFVSTVDTLDTAPGATTILANDSDPDADPLFIESVSTDGGTTQIVDGGVGDLDGVENGFIQFATTGGDGGAVVTLDVDGSDGGLGEFTYDTNGAFDILDAGQTDTDSFQYTIADGDGTATGGTKTDTATVTMTITGADDDARVLNGLITTNTNQTNQFALLMFFDPNQMINSFSQYISLDDQGQEGNFAADAGFVIDDRANFAVSIEHGEGTKVILTEMTLEGVTVFDSGTTQFTEEGANTPGGKPFALTAVINPETSEGDGDGNLEEGPTLSTDGDPLLNDATLSDPTTDGTINYLFGASGDDILTGSGDTDVLNGGGGADELWGMGGNDMLVYDSLDTVINGGDGQDALRIDGNPLATGDQAISLEGNTVISNIEVILLTEESSVDPDDGIDLTLSDQDVLDFTDGNDELWIVGSAGDELVVTDESGTVWSDGGLTDVNGAEFQLYIGDDGQNLYVDTDITTNIVI
ncbi:MAG: beta strand repeat-containing protein [Planctomycetota bacterium]|jgi:VCBS repeat-containing protein